jgi:hypothetical protein
VIDQEESAMSSLRPIIPVLFALTLCAPAGNAVACGEVLSRTGNALRYHSFVSRHPAEILVFAEPAGRNQSPDDGKRFRDNLERAGHRVTMVSDTQSLEEAFATHTFDVVITYADDLDGVTAQVARAAREPTLIPVVRRDAPDARELRARYPRLLTDNANLNQFLKSIEQSMKARGA